ncbi:hypothetical protein JXA56_03840 [Candidatus Micrarchaeota archaeon]|nr:hypothetical protein [Candidatus Micrarchaeota archaeon]
MNIFSVMKKANDVGKYFLAVILVMNLLPVVFAATGGAGITSALSALCVLSLQILGTGIILMIILAGAIYAIGQIMGAETRARASVWATAMLTGAVIAAIIYILVPWIIGMILGGGTGGTGCDFSVA